MGRSTCQAYQCNIHDLFYYFGGRAVHERRPGRGVPNVPPTVDGGTSIDPRLLSRCYGLRSMGTGVATVYNWGSRQAVSLAELPT